MNNKGAVLLELILAIPIISIIIILIGNSFQVHSKGIRKIENILEENYSLKKIEFIFQKIIDNQDSLSLNFPELSNKQLLLNQLKIKHRSDYIFSLKAKVSDIYSFNEPLNLHCKLFSNSSVVNFRYVLVLSEFDYQLKEIDNTYTQNCINFIGFNGIYRYIIPITDLYLIYLDNNNILRFAQFKNNLVLENQPLINEINNISINISKDFEYQVKVKFTKNEYEKKFLTQITKNNYINFYTGLKNYEGIY